MDKQRAKEELTQPRNERSTPDECAGALSSLTLSLCIKMIDQEVRMVGLMMRQLSPRDKSGDINLRP